jgi:hypothetical protein
VFRIERINVENKIVKTFICKRSLKNGINNLVIGKKYKLLDIQDNDTTILIDSYNRYIFFSNHKGEKYIWDYFYTPEEIRKMKLKSI